MRLIPNEVLYAEKCLKYNRINNSDPIKSVREVILYFHFIHEMSQEDIFENVKHYIINCDMEHKIDFDYLKDTYIDKVIKTTKGIKTIESVGITQKEIDSIMNNKYAHSYRKILFVLLVAFKSKYKTNGIKNDKIEMDEVEILKDAHVTMTKAKRYDMWRTFEGDGLITIGECKQGNETFLHYIDYDNKDYVIEVTDFDDYYMFFEQYCKGGKLKYCEVCGKLILVKGKASTKYCDKCKREKELENTRLRVNKHRNERQV